MDATSSRMEYASNVRLGITLTNSMSVFKSLQLAAASTPRRRPARRATPATL